MTPHPRSHPKLLQSVILGLVLAAMGGDPGAAEIRKIASVRIVAPGSDPDYRPVFSEERLRRELRRHAGADCDPPTIAESLARRYRFLGYVPAITAHCVDGALSVSVRESSHRIVLIAFDPDELSRIGVRREVDFDTGPRRFFPVPADAPRGVLRGLLQTLEGDLYNFERYRVESRALARLGYAIVFVAGPSTPGDEYPVAAYLVQSLRPRPTGARAGGRKKNYLGGDATLAPRSGVTTGLTYQRSDLFGRLNRLTVAPDFNAALGGSLSYVAPFIATRHEPRRLYDLEFRLFSDFHRDRLLDGQENDQRRNGASLALGVRPLSLRPAHEVKWTLGLRHERVILENPIPGGDEDRLTVVRLGVVHVYRHIYRSPKLSLRIAPGVDVSIDAAGGRRSFVRPELDTTLHARFMSGFEIEHHLLAGTLNRDVPEFELWSLGGATTVRGFKEDSFLGRHLVAFQSELWIPFIRPLEARPVAPAGDPGAVPYEPRAARRIKGALFVDAGYLSDSNSGRVERILGAGVGLRFVVPRHPLVIRVDYGWGLGGRGGDSFPYVSLGYRF